MPDLNLSGASILGWTRRLWEATSPDRPRSALALAIANLIPLAGAVFLGWNVGAIVVLYWFECGIAGILNVVKIALAQGEAATAWLGRVGGILAKAGTILFFVVHYGVFLLGTAGGVLFVAVAAGGSLPTSSTDLQQAYADIDLPVGGLVVSLAALVFGHLVSFNDYLVRRDYERTDLTVQMFAPYPRLFMLMAAVLSSGAVIAVMGSPAWAVAGFVVGKTWLDLHLRSSRRGKPS